MLISDLKVFIVFIKHNDLSSSGLAFLADSDPIQLAKLKSDEIALKSVRTPGKIQDLL